MFDADRFFLGIGLALAGMALFLLAYLGFRPRLRLPGRRAQSQQPPDKTQSCRCEELDTAFFAESSDEAISARAPKRRLLRRERRKSTVAPSSQRHVPSPGESSPRPEAAILVRPGGRILYANRAAREWLAESGKPLNLERIARRARPHEAFFAACTREGRTSFTLDGRPVGAASTWVPVDRHGAMLVTLHRLQVLTGSYALPGGNASHTDSAIAPTHFLDVFTRLNQAMTASLELEPTLTTVLENVENLIPAVFAEITIWDPDEQVLVPYSLSRSTGQERQLKKSDQRYHPGEGYSGYLIEKRSSLFIPDVARRQDVQPAADRRQYPFRSYMGVPLLIGGEIVGTLELASIVREAFDQEDLEILKMLAGQAAVALHNAQMYRSEQRRTRELVGLAKLAQSTGGINETQDLVQRLVESMAALLNVEILGFLMFDENSHLLAALPPFHGFPPDFLSFYQVPVPPGSLAESTLLAQEAIVTSNAPEDPRLQALGLQHAAIASDIQHAAFVPLSSGGRLRGYLQAANKTDGSPFNQDDIRLLSIMGGQAALSLENAALVQQTQQRAYRAEALRQIASLTSSIATLDEVLKWSLLEIVRLVAADIGAVFLLDEAGAELRLHPGSLAGVPDTSTASFQPISVADGLLESSACGSQHAFQSGNASQDEQLPGLYRPLIEQLEIETLIIVPLVIRERGIGEIHIASRKMDRFDHNDFLTIATAAGQLAGAIERSALAAQTDESLRRRVETMGELLSVSQALQANQPLEQSLGLIAGGIQKVTPFEIVLISILNPGSADLERVAGAGLDTGVLQELLSTRQPWSGIQKILREDFRTGGVYFIPFEKLPVLPPEIHSYTPLPLEQPDQSESAWHPDDTLIVPLRDHSGSPLGLISVDKPRDGQRPDRPTLESLELFANQAAIALENSLLFAQTRQMATRLEQRVEERTAQLSVERERLAQLLHIITELTASLDLDQVLSRTLLLLQGATSSDWVTCLVWRPGEPRLRQAASAGDFFTEAELEDGWLSDAQAGFASGILFRRQTALIADLNQDERSRAFVDKLKDLRSLLGVPLMVSEQLLGVLLLASPEKAHYSGDHIELVQAIARQIAVAVNNAELYSLIRDQAEDLGSMLRNQQIETSRSRAILEAVAEGVLVTDSSSQITLFNRSAAKILGLERQKVIGRSLENLTGMFGGAARDWMETIRSWSSSPAETATRAAYSEQISLDSGRVVSVNLAPVFSRDEFLGTVSIFHDITQQIELDRMKSEFVATASHELRTPMTSIKGYTELLLMGAAGELSEQQSHFLEAVRANTERLAVLVNDLLDISRIESGRLSLSLQPVELHELVSEVMGEFEKRAREEQKEFQFLLEKDRDQLLVQADPQRLQEILHNLISNAYQYTEKGGSLSLRIQRSGEMAQVDLRDTGIGIRGEEQSHIFERFYRGEHPLVLSTSGTGLGLSIVKHLVELHGGQIWLQSDGIPGKGSLFSFTLPLYQAEPAELSQAAMG